MYAPILTFDRHRQFARLVIESYSRLWKSHPFIFRVPYNEEFPGSISNESDVELVRTSKDVRSTIDNLLLGIGDDEFIFWTIDDRYPVKIRNFEALDEILEFVSENPTNIDAIKLVNHGREICDTKVQKLFGNTEFRLQTRSPAIGFYMHHFVRAGVLRRYFLEFDLPDNYALSQLTEKLAQAKVSERILMPERSLIWFGEPCTRGKVTVNALYDLRKYNLNAPDIDHTNQIIVYGDRGERISILKYRFERVRQVLKRKLS